MLPFDPKKPRYGFTMRAPHAKRRIHLFDDEEKICLLFRPKNAEEDWVGAIFRYKPITWLLKRSYGIGRHVRPQIATGRIFRVFHLADPRADEQRVWRILWRPDFAYAIPLEHPDHIKGAFFWPQKSSFNISLWNTPTHVIQRHFSTEWHDADSDVRDALSWCDLSETERRWRSIEWSCGGRQELESVLRAAYVYESDWQRNEVLLIHWLFTPGTYPVARGDFQTKQGRLLWELNSEHRLARIANRLGERNHGIVNQPTGGRLDWHLSWERNQPLGTAYDMTNMMFQIEPPTQHERLEAALFLRDWLRENAPDLLPDWFPDAV